MGENVKIKICGLTRTADIETVNMLLPDYIGFVFWEKSRRNLKEDAAAELKKQLDKRIKAVGVFVDEDSEKILSLVEKGIIDIIQLHGNEDEEYIDYLRQRTDAEIIKAFNVGIPGSLEKAEQSSADYIMLDPGKGDGNTFDWQMLGAMKRPYFLAGGLSPENVGEAIRLLKPYAVDVSSGVETDGLKDPEKMKAFTEKVRNYSYR